MVFAAQCQEEEPEEPKPEAPKLNMCRNPYKDLLEELFECRRKGSRPWGSGPNPARLARLGPF